jgi:hypothetical protein
MNPTTEVSSSAKLEKTSAVLTRIHRIKRGNLVVSVGVFDEQFFIKEENNLAGWLSGLIHELDGTTTWEETTDLELENLKRNTPISDN